MSYVPRPRRAPAPPRPPPPVPLSDPRSSRGGIIAMSYVPRPRRAHAPNRYQQKPLLLPICYPKAVIFNRRPDTGEEVDTMKKMKGASSGRVMTVAAAALLVGLGLLLYPVFGGGGIGRAGQ